MTRTSDSKDRDSTRKVKGIMSRIRLPRLRRLGGEQGYSLVEVSLLVSFFGVPLLLGAVEMGRLAYAGIEVSNAARAGAAFASQSVADSTDTTDTTTAATNEANDVEGVSVTQSTFCVCSNSPSTTVTCSSVTTSCTGTGNHGISFVQVNTAATVNPVLRFPGLPASVTLRGEAAMRIGQ
jgi:Flp pilus assembly protein TadG